MTCFMNYNKHYVSGGLRRCGIGGLIGFSLATALSLITSRDRIKEIGKTIIHS